MEYIAHPFPFKNHKLKIKQERSHLFFQSLISYRKAWDSIVCSSLPIQLFDSASIALESVAGGAGTLFIAPCKKNKWKHEDCAFVGVVSRLKKRQEGYCFHPAKCWRFCIFYQSTCDREREICAHSLDWLSVSTFEFDLFQNMQNLYCQHI